MMGNRHRRKKTGQNRNTLIIIVSLLFVVLLMAVAVVFFLISYIRQDGSAEKNPDNNRPGTEMTATKSDNTANDFQTKDPAETSAAKDPEATQEPAVDFSNGPLLSYKDDEKLYECQYPSSFVKNDTAPRDYLVTAMFTSEETEGKIILSMYTDVGEESEFDRAGLEEFTKEQLLLAIPDGKMSNLESDGFWVKGRISSATQESYICSEASIVNGVMNKIKIIRIDYPLAENQQYDRLINKVVPTFRFLHTEEVPLETPSATPTDVSKKYVEFTDDPMGYKILYPEKFTISMEENYNPGVYNCSFASEDGSIKITSFALTAGDNDLAELKGHLEESKPSAEIEFVNVSDGWSEGKVLLKDDGTSIYEYRKHFINPKTNEQLTWVYSINYPSGKEAEATEIMNTMKASFLTTDILR